MVSFTICSHISDYFNRLGKFTNFLRSLGKERLGQAGETGSLTNSYMTEREEISAV